MSLPHLVAEFGRSVGMDGLQLNAQGVVCLGVGSTGDLYLEGADSDAVVYLLKDLSFPHEKLFREALKICHPAERLPFPANAGMRGENRLGFFIRLTTAEQTLPQLETAIDQLRRMHERLDHVAA